MGCSSSKTATDTVAPTSAAAETVVRKSPPSVQSEETRPETPIVEKEQIEAAIKPVAELVAEKAKPAAEKAAEVIVEKVEPVAPGVAEKVEPTVEKVAEVVTENVEPVTEKVTEFVAENVEKVAELAASTAVSPVEEPVNAPVVDAPEAQETLAAEITVCPVEEPVAAPTMSPEAQEALAVAMDAQKTLLSYYNGNEFAPQGKAGAVELFMRPQSDAERQVVCGKMSFGAVFTAEQVKDFLMDITVKSSWDGMFQDGRLLASFIDEEQRSLSTSWAAYKKQMGVAGRDFTYVTLCEPVGDKIVISTRSMDLPEYPEAKFLASHCRGNIDNAGYVIETINGEVVVSFYNQLNPGGSVPTWIVNRVQMKQPSSLSETFKAMKKRAGK